MRGGERSISRGPSLAPRPGSSRSGSSSEPVAADDDGSDADVAAAVASDPRSDDEEVPEAQAENGVSVNAAAALERRGRSRMPLSAQPSSHDDIWCTLVFRMICWLMLHDFNKLDRQLPKSELLGSRVPVYIT